MSKIKVSNEEVMRILSLHENYKKSLVVEQTEPATRNRTELIQFFAKAKANLCLTDPNLKYDAPFRTTGESRGYIKGPSNRYSGMDKRIYDDFSVEVIDPSSLAVIVKTTWACDALKPVQPKKDESKKEGPKPLDSNQTKILDLIKPSGWFHEPAPTDVEVDQNLYQKLDLSGVKNVEGVSDELGLVDKYKKYFIATDFPNGFFIYKKTGPQTPAVQRKTGLTVTSESCKIAIETLWNSVKNPNSYSLTDQEVSDYKKTAEICAQPENSEKFLLRFKLKDKLKDLVNSKYRINSRL
jgi:hypothetical protein